MAVSFQASKFALLPDDDEDLNKKALRNLKNTKTETSKVENSKTKSKAKKKNKKNKSEASTVSDAGQEGKKPQPNREGDLIENRESILTHRQDEKSPKRFDEIFLPTFLLKIRSHFRQTENWNYME